MSSATPDVQDHAGLLLLSLGTAWLLGRQLTPAGAIVSPTTLVGLVAWTGAAFLFFTALRWSR